MPARLEWRVIIGLKLISIGTRLSIIYTKLPIKKEEGHDHVISTNCIPLLGKRHQLYSIEHKSRFRLPPFPSIPKKRLRPFLLPSSPPNSRLRPPHTSLLRGSLSISLPRVVVNLVDALCKQPSADPYSSSRMANTNPNETPGDEFLEQILGLPNFPNHPGDPSSGLASGDAAGGGMAPPPMMLQLGSGDAAAAFGMGVGVGGGGYHGGAVFPLGLSLELEQGKGGVGVGGSGGGGGYLKVEEGGSASAAAAVAKRFHDEVVVDGRASAVKNVR